MDNNSLAGLINKALPDGSVYTDSFFSAPSGSGALVRTAEGPLLVVTGGLAGSLEGERLEVMGTTARLCPLSYDNACALMEELPFMRPSQCDKALSLGLGDRLGLASPGHIKVVRGREIFPVLAQQSMRELGLTGRTYGDVVAAAAFAVLQCGYKEGYGADGDHLKTDGEIADAIASGCSMITLDCSEHIRNITGLSEVEVDEAYDKLPGDLRTAYEQNYQNREIDLGTTSLFVDEKTLCRTAVIYTGMLAHARGIYFGRIEPARRGLDFELSVDETDCPTDPAAHFIIASELEREGIRVTGLAPRFVGEFQKGIDYIGGLCEFERDFALHQAVAELFGYRLSVHSGSDKFSIFPVMRKHCGGKLHVKTAGTNWLIALGVVAEAAPGLYRDMVDFALAHCDEAKKYYKINADAFSAREGCPSVSLYRPEGLGCDGLRQVMHVTYGLLLSADMFRGPFFEALRRSGQEYEEALVSHIGKHIELLV